MAVKKIPVEFVVPIYNEEIELESSITKLRSYLQKNLSNFDCLITIADNASTDNSLKIAGSLKKRYKNVNFFHLNQKGRGRAVKEVWRASKADIMMYMDVDLSTDLKSIKPTIQSIIKGCDIAIGSRLLPGSKVVGRTLRREIMSRVYNFLIKLMFGTRFSDAQCGFKAVSRKVVREVIPHISDNAWFFDSELLIVSEKLGYKIHEEPVYWVDNPGSTVRVMKTVTGDLKGLMRLFLSRPWRMLKINES